MANLIELASTYVNALDMVYNENSLTGVLDGPRELIQQGGNAAEFIIPTLNMDGLGDYSRNSGYTDGDVEMKNETVKCNFDRGRMFNVDTMDDAETAGLAFGRLAGEFVRTKVVPELDAFRFACYAGKNGISKNTAALASGQDVIAALREATTQMDENEVPFEDRYLFITPTLDGMIMDLDTTKSREVLGRFAAKILVPQTRFYTAIEQLNGQSPDEKKGGYRKADGAADINFMVCHKDAVIQFQKHIAPKIIPPEHNQNADAWKYGYHNVGIADVYKNKVAGIYVSHK